MPLFTSPPRLPALRLVGAGPSTAAAPPEPVIVDLTAVASLDAAVVRILLEALSACELRERPFLLLLPADEDAPVCRLFRFSGLGGVLPIVSSWDEALRRAGLAQPDAPG